LLLFLLWILQGSELFIFQLERMKGKLIVIDGTDGSGKGTQTELLVKKLESE
jgi:ABC-type transport system involved in cytochrome bd biosynthesis fused ATPase/permease subunit